MAGKTYYWSPTIGGTYYGTLIPLESGQSVDLVILVGCKPPAKDAIRDRWRPTGEVGSGPYFNAYRQPPSGVFSYYSKGIGYQLHSNNADQEAIGINGFGKPCYNRHLANGNEVYSFTWLGAGHTLMNRYYAYYGAVENPVEWVIGSVNNIKRATYTGTATSVDQAMQFCAELLDEARHHAWSKTRSCWVMQDYAWVDNTPKYSSFNYLLKERINFEENIYFDDTLIGAYRSCADNAYINAAENLPEATTNSIMNVLEIAATFASFAKGYSGIGSLKDAWLGYRYQYGTTTLDITEYADLTYRLCELANMPRFTVYGSASRYGITANVQFDINVSDFLPHDAKTWLKAYGFKLSAVNVWDMIPYSFVVDWFLHVGDILQKFEDYQQMYHLKITNAWVTFTTAYDGQKTYQRLPYHFQGSLPWMTFGGASTKTIGKRVLDTVALFLVK